MNVPVPKNVRVQRKDTGEVMPVELVYAGWDEDEEVHVWEAVPTSPAMSHDVTVWIDELPARTSVVLRYEGDWEGL